MSKPMVLIIEDDQAAAHALRSALEDECEVLLSSRERMSSAQEQDPLVTLLGLESPSSPHQNEGLRFLHTWREAGHGEKVISWTT